MSFAACPRCKDEISVPLGVRPSARVRCPLCREEMLLSEVLDRLPPMLEVLDAADAAPAWQSAGETVYSPSDYAADDHSEYAPAKDDAMGGMVAAATATAPIVGASTRIRERKQPSIVGEMVKIVLGGVVGIVMALGVLWWLLDRDPLKLGPTVAAYVPQVVPEKFQGKPIDKPANPGVRPSTDVTPSVPNNKPNNNTPPSKTQNFETPVTPPGGESPFTQAFNKNKPPEEDPTTVQKPEAGPTAFELTEQFGLVERANEEFKEGATLSAAERRQLGSNLYDAFADTGAKLAAANLADADIAQGLAFGQNVLKQAHAGTPVPVLAFFAGQRLDTGEDQAGVAIPAEVTDFKSAGKWFEMTVHMLPKKEREIVVVFKTNPQDQAKIGDKVLVLGSLEKTPSNLPGYKGEAAEVVKGGMVIAAE